MAHTPHAAFLPVQAGVLRGCAAALSGRGSELCGITWLQAVLGQCIVAGRVQLQQVWVTTPSLLGRMSCCFVLGVVCACTASSGALAVWLNPARLQ